MKVHLIDTKIIELMQDNSEMLARYEYLLSCEAIVCREEELLQNQYDFIEEQELQKFK